MLQIFLLKIAFYPECSHKLLQRLCLSGKRRFLGKVSNLVRNYRKSVILDILTCVWIRVPSCKQHVFVYINTYMLFNIKFCILHFFCIYYAFLQDSLHSFIWLFCTHTLCYGLNRFNYNIFYNTPHCFKILSLFVS